MNSTKKIRLLLLSSILLLSSCLHDPVIPASPVVAFSSDVQPILIGNCTQSGCHSGSNSGGHDNLFPLVTYDDVLNIVTPGNARNSKLYESITGRSEKLMPPSSQPMLTDIQINYIYLWIEQGAKNN